MMRPVSFKPHLPSLLTSHWGTLTFTEAGLTFLSFGYYNARMLASSFCSASTFFILGDHQWVVLCNFISRSLFCSHLPCTKSAVEITSLMLMWGQRKADNSSCSICTCPTWSPWFQLTLLMSDSWQQFLCFDCSWFYIWWFSWLPLKLIWLEKDKRIKLLCNNTAHQWCSNHQSWMFIWTNPTVCLESIKKFQKSLFICSHCCCVFGLLTLTIEFCFILFTKIWFTGEVSWSSSTKWRQTRTLNRIPVLSDLVVIVVF